MTQARGPLAPATARLLLEHLGDVIEQRHYAREEPVRRAGLLDGYGPLPPEGEARLALYRLHHTLALWSWFARIGRERPLPAWRPTLRGWRSVGDNTTDMRRELAAVPPGVSVSRRSETHQSQRFVVFMGQVAAIRSTKPRLYGVIGSGVDGLAPASIASLYRSSRHVPSLRTSPSTRQDHSVMDA